MSDKTLDQIAGDRLGTHPEQIGAYRNEWEASPKSAIIKTLLSVKLESLRDERLGKLETCQPEDLKTLQGEIRGLKLALSVVANRIVT